MYEIQLRTRDGIVTVESSMGESVAWNLALQTIIQTVLQCPRHFLLTVKVVGRRDERLWSGQSDPIRLDRCKCLAEQR